jgi:hypothetical protein
MKAPSMAIPDAMKQSGTSTGNTSDWAPEPGSWNISKDAPLANKTKT